MMGLRKLREFYESFEKEDIQKTLKQKISEIMAGNLEEAVQMSKQYFVLCEVARTNVDFRKDEIDKYMLKYSQAISYLVEKIEKGESK